MLAVSHGIEYAVLQVLEELSGVGVSDEAADKILAAMGTRSVDDLEQLLGADNEAVADLRQLFTLAEAYGMADWLVFDASVVRGLSYYTGNHYHNHNHETSHTGHHASMTSLTSGKAALCCTAST